MKTNWDTNNSLPAKQVDTGKLTLPCENEDGIFRTLLKTTIILLARNKSVTLNNSSSTYYACIFGVVVCLLYHFAKAALQYYTSIYLFDLDIFITLSQEDLKDIFSSGLEIFPRLALGTTLMYLLSLLTWSLILFGAIRFFYSSVIYSQILRICAYSSIAMLPALVPVIGVAIYWYYGLVLPSRLISNTYSISYRKILLVVVLVNLVPILLSTMLPLPIGATFPFYY